MVSRVRTIMKTWVVGVGVAALAAAAAAAPEDEAVDDEDADVIAPAVLPTPFPFVSGLDLECFNTPGPALNIQLTLTHLNPVLLSLGMPPHAVILRELEQTCVPVMKNNVVPPASALPFIRHVDLACYRIDAQPVTVQPVLALKHLNPVLAALPVHPGKPIRAVQLCLPVIKNNVPPPTAEILNFVRFIDLECFATEQSAHPTFGLQLQQLNPQLTAIPPHGLTLGPQNRQLCVPVRKNQQQIPTPVLNVIKWLDLEKFQALTPVIVPSTPVTLNHINPLFTTLPPVQVKLERSEALMVPVSKNNATPPP